MHFSNEMFKIRYQYLKFLTMYKLISGSFPKKISHCFSCRRVTIGSTKKPKAHGSPGI